jgi:multimeric flavodoxin WrbA
MARILGFSGSPIKGGSIEKGLSAVLEATGAETEMIRLSELDMRFCRGCKGCVATNRCVLKDDVSPLMERIEKADGIVFSAYPSFGSVNALTKAFIERNWPLRHNRLLTKGKAGAAVVAGRSDMDSLEEYFRHYFVDYLGADYQGSLRLGGNVPCMTCGFGEGCQGSGFLKEHGPGAKVTHDKFYRFEESPGSQARARELGRALGRAVAGK